MEDRGPILEVKQFYLTCKKCGCPAKLHVDGPMTAVGTGWVWQLTLVCPQCNAAECLMKHC